MRAVSLPAINKTFLGDPTNTTNNATALSAQLLAAVDKTSGVAELNFLPGVYYLEWAADISALYAAGVRKIVLDGNNVATLTHTNSAPCIDFDNNARAGAAQSITAYSLQNYQSYDYIHRLSIASSGYAVNDKLHLHSQDRPPYDSTNRFIGEGCRVKFADATYVWAGKQLGHRSRYTAEFVARKIDDEITIEIRNFVIRPKGNSADTGITSRSNAYSFVFTAACNVRVEGCRFEEPWYVSNRFETCFDCVVKECSFVDGLNNPTANQLTYAAQFYNGCYNCWLEDCFITGYRHGMTTDGNSSQTVYNSSNWMFMGDPDSCGMKNCVCIDCKGAPGDTHEEGLFITIEGCTFQNCMSADENAAFIGAGVQVRCERTLVKDCTFRECNWGISWKPYEHGTDSWLKVENCTFNELSYTSDQGRGIYVSTGGTLTNAPTLKIINCDFDLCGVSIENDLATPIEIYNSRSARPHRTHVDLATGYTWTEANCVWDSRCSVMPNAASVRTILMYNLAGTGSSYITNHQHIFGTNASAAVAPKNIFETDATGSKTVVFLNYDYLDPAATGWRSILESGAESNFTATITNARPRARTHTTGALTLLAEDDIVYIRKASTTAITYTPIAYKTQTVVDSDGNANAFNDTITPSTGNIMGAATYVMSTNRETVTMIHDGTETVII